MKLSLPSRARFVRQLSLTKTQTLGNRESHKISDQSSTLVPCFVRPHYTKNINMLRMPEQRERQKLQTERLAYFLTVTLIESNSLLSEFDTFSLIDHC